MDPKVPRPQVGEAQQAGAAQQAIGTRRPGPAALLDLQRTSGNRAVGALLRAQAKLEVGPAHDAYEAEADAVADRVSHTGDVTAPAGDGAAPAHRLQRRSAPSANLAGATVDPAVERALATARGGGAPLASETRRRMDGAFGADFSAVRVHHGPDSADLNHQLGAKAFTLGREIYFRDAVPDMSSGPGRHLLAHELAHTVQQGAATPHRVQRAPEEEPPAAGGNEAEVLSDTLPDGNLDNEPVQRKGPSDRQSQGHRSRGSSGAGDHRVGVSVGSVGVSASVAKTDRVAEVAGEGPSDAVGASVVGTSWTNPGGMTVDAFGEEAFTASYGGLKFTYTQKSDGSNRKIWIGFKLKAKCKWGVTSGGHKDVPSGTSSVVTADNYQAIVDDLTPQLVEGSWVAERDAYWSKTISTRHEKFHATDDKSWIEGAGKAHIIAYLNAQTITLTDAELGSKSAFKQKVKVLMDDAVDDLETANITDFYKGGAASYYSYAGEVRAFGDGRQPYLDLVAAVKKQGQSLSNKKLAKSAKKASKTAGATAGAGTGPP